MKKRIFLDIDDTIKDLTGYVVRKYIDKFCCDLSHYDRDELYDMVFRGEDKGFVKALLGDYSKIPYIRFAEGFIEWCKTFASEVLLCSCWTFEEERLAKEKLAFELGLPLISIRYGGVDSKSKINMEGSVFIDDNKSMLLASNASLKILKVKKGKEEEDKDGLIVCSDFREMLYYIRRFYEGEDRLLAI